MAKKKVKTKKKVSVGKPLKVVSKKSKKVSVKAVPPRKVSKKNVKNVSLKRVPKRKVSRKRFFPQHSPFKASGPI